MLELLAVASQECNPDESPVHNRANTPLTLTHTYSPINLICYLLVYESKPEHLENTWPLRHVNSTEKDLKIKPGSFWLCAKNWTTIMPLHFTFHIHMTSGTCCQEASLQHTAATTLVDTVLSVVEIACLSNQTLLGGH